VIVAVVLVVRRIVEDGWLDPMGSARFVCGGWTRVFCVFFFSLVFFYPFFPLGPFFMAATEWVFIGGLRDAKSPELGKSSLLMTKPLSLPLIFIL